MYVTSLDFLAYSANTIMIKMLFDDNMKDPSGASQKYIYCISQNTLFLQNILVFLNILQTTTQV